MNPSLIYIYQFIDKECKLLKKIINKSYLQLMGVTTDIFIDFVLHTGNMPCIFSKETYLKFWNDYIETKFKQKPYLEIDITTYDELHLTGKMTINT